MMNRRKFITTGALLGSGLAFSRTYNPIMAKKITPSDKITIGVMGLGGRNLYLIEEFIKQGAEIGYICDVDNRRIANGLKACSGESWQFRDKQDWGISQTSVGQSRVPKTTQDFRRILDDKDIDAMIISPGTHWAPLATIMACQAGKDVYVEKPMSPNVYEGRKMVEASRKYSKIVQVGSQNRSGKYHEEAIKFLKEGNIGKIHYIRVLNMLNQQIGSPGPYPEMPIPDGFDYDMWCGPAPKRPYNSKKTGPGVWRYFWDYSGSDSESIHQLDIARWITSELTGMDYPLSVFGKGAVRYPERVADIPDSLTAIYDYGDISLELEVDWWSSLIKIPIEIRASKALFPNWQFTGTRIEIYGTNGMMYLGRHGGGWQAFNEKGEIIAIMTGVNPVEEHIENFMHCIRTRETPNADIEKAQISQAISHMAYIAYRVGNQLLKIDGVNERFIDNTEANKLLARQDGGRAPWKIPEKV